MSDFLTRLAERTLGLTPPVQPLHAPRYAPDVAGPEPSPTGLETPEQETAHARAPVPSRHSPLDAATPARDPDHRRVRAPDPTEKKRVSSVAEEEATVSPDPVSLDRRSVGALPPEVGTPQPEIGKQEPSSSPTTGHHVPGTPDLARPGLPLSARKQDDASPGRSTEAEHEALSTSDARPMTTPSDPGDEDAPVPARREPGGPPAGTQKAEQTQGTANVPSGEGRGARLSGGSVEDGFRDESVLERPVESPLAWLPEMPEPGVEDAPSSADREDVVESSLSEATIRVTIGRIDVRAVSPPAPAQRRAERPVPGLSLDDYLRSHSGGAS